MSKHHRWQSVGGNAAWFVCSECGLIRWHSRSYSDMHPDGEHEYRKTAGACPPASKPENRGRPGVVGEVS